jgi:hypothetical protein
LNPAKKTAPPAAMADSEIDGILLITMRHAGCDIPESMTVAMLEPDVIVKITSHCLALAGGDFPRFAKAQLPPASQQSSRFRVCNVLSEAVKKLVRWSAVVCHSGYLIACAGLQE